MKCTRRQKKPSTSGTVSYDIRLPESLSFEALASHIIPLSRDQAPQRLLARLPHPFGWLLMIVIQYHGLVGREKQIERMLQNLFDIITPKMWFPSGETQPERLFTIFYRRTTPKASLDRASHFMPTVTISNLIQRSARRGNEPLTRGFSERPRARPPPFVEALFYLYVFNIKTILIIPHLSWSESKWGQICWAWAQFRHKR